MIDLGCLPDTPFPHLEDAVRELKARGFAVSVDSAEPDELRRGGAAGADYLLSLTERNLAIAEETGARPVLIPAQHGDLASLYRAAEEAREARSQAPFSTRFSIPSISASPTRSRAIARCARACPRRKC